MMLHPAGMLVCLPARSRQVAHGMPRAILRADHAVGDLQVTHRPPQTLGRLGEERLVRGGRCPAQLHAAARCRRCPRWPPGWA